MEESYGIMGIVYQEIIGENKDVSDMVIKNEDLEFTTKHKRS